MYVARNLSGALRQARSSFPSVLVTGPRQSGKTTFLRKETGSNTAYVSFDDPIERGFARADPHGFLDRFGENPVILDEVQYAPEILSYLKMRIDRDRKANGKWLLTGSQHFHLMKNVSESLAGRIAILELLPFSILEHEVKGRDMLQKTVWNGGYPEPALHPAKREMWVRSYIQTYIERDVRQLQNIKDLRNFEMFISLTAAYHGQLFNTAIFSREIGVSLPTIKSWAGVMEASYLCYFLSPYHRNYGKRVVKTPKLYFLDSAIVCSLSKQPDAISAISGAMGGALLEGYLVSEAVKVFAMRGMKPDITFWRSHDGLEVDLIINIKGKLYPVEIKSTSTPTLMHFDPINKFRSIAGKDAAESGILVCRIEKASPMPNNNIALPWHQFSAWLYDRLL
jgi:predicted AAA+ superfamily ATPase